MFICGGNSGGGEAGVGPRVAELLAGAGVEVRIVDGHATTLLDAWAGLRWAIVVDAVVTGALPGTVHRWDGLPEMTGAASSTHGRGVGEAIQLGRIVGNVPPRLVVIGIEAETFE